MGSFDVASFALPWSLPGDVRALASVLEAVVCLVEVLGWVDLRLKSFSLMLWTIFDMAAVVMKSGDSWGYWRRAECNWNAKRVLYSAGSYINRGFDGVGDDDDGHVRLNRTVISQLSGVEHWLVEYKGSHAGTIWGILHAGTQPLPAQKGRTYIMPTTLRTKEVWIWVS